jgi:hypothetical protein
MLKAYFSRLQRVLTIHACDQAKKSLEENQKQQKILEAMLAVAQNDNGNRDEVDSK